MKIRSLFTPCLLVLSIAANAGTYDQPMANGAQWLASQQNSDGSWGNSPGVQAVYTSAAVRALGTAYKRQTAFFAGLTWLESHEAGNVDLISRRAGALTGHGDNLGYALTYLQNAQSLNGGVYAGWGLSSNYNSSAIDTALALIAYSELGSNVQVQAALDFLKSSQRAGANDQGWAIGNADSSDPATTALVLQALAHYTAQDASLTPVIGNGLNTLNTLVDSAAPTVIQALAVQAAQEAGDSGLANTFLSRLIASQSATDGSWNADLYTTALATRAVATAANASVQSTPVAIPDQALRRAINQALGRNSMDYLNRGELAQLTSLTAVNQGIADLTGLEWAVNLASADLNDNNLTSIAPLDNLTHLASLDWTGNPGNPGVPVQVPAVPIPGQRLMALGLFITMRHFCRSPIVKGA
ncbi:prenyltransferase/squalene oxidase repeat-containing protein [Methylomonas methanica]|uniref:Squalene cyclase C-terminal domain-containing protein n=1 Tax=Methylomonas methanica (strain DSM 25384 / MC09) TaxID=857087 RepID=F9ZZ06_METMM|nr:prenyltransferase/squalene oxidase repeat-containing protein [Methylomonas methanica]AEF99861.1 hypothetical protein Metme_1438 [Methylomonas methanica MC09]